MFFDLLLFIIAGSFAGIMAGLLGIGGGLIIVPALSIIFTTYKIVPQDIVMHVASGTSLCVMIFTAQFSLWGHYKHGDILWALFKKMLVFIAMGTVVGGIFADLLPTYVIKQVFGGFLLVVALHMYLNRKATRRKFVPPDWFSRTIGGVIGMVSGFLGIGGGVIMIPYLSRCKIQIRKIASISTLCSLTVAIVGTFTVIITGWNDNPVAWSTGYVYWPAVLLAALPSALFARIAARWTYIIPLRFMKAIFIFLLLVIGIKMLW